MSVSYRSKMNYDFLQDRKATMGKGHAALGKNYFHLFNQWHGQKCGISMHRFS